jgi:hypothetical protein
LGTYIIGETRFQLLTETPPKGQLFILKTAFYFEAIHSVGNFEIKNSTVS